MMQTHFVWKPFIPMPYNYMQRLGTFETSKTNIDSSLWMNQDQNSYKKLATLEYMAELKNREDLIKNGFKIKPLRTPEWIQKKCGGDIFKDIK